MLHHGGKMKHIISMKVLHIREGGVGVGKLVTFLAVVCLIGGCPDLQPITTTSIRHFLRAPRYLPTGSEVNSVDPGVWYRMCSADHTPTEAVHIQCRLLTCSVRRTM